ncbi:hypothetical protein KAFR_0F01770 [Kazachstania africana CBS 2517]|uniref:Histone-lysine N-methyltransferase, H3 lysine-36 specific n=1 Tax=Kazachstania africana (strain ATCC 22294 / BCRC 22015 / CBS 2517 / CECT 1963 / NBRC 1671 / NRRL Y-8276) TaxID=1071382 RepID=H2AWM4_KAZAF|nr:hypothetical protein KAFR_0F01770 [Kazachstania africana CBS 2517]CCF58774.1 hypothetical protein KAFR_0F01770 [Kazachstania africana CBS 2517]
MSSSSNSPSTVIQAEVRLFLDEEDKTVEALSTFTALDTCTYQNKSLGNSPNEFMDCDCFENIIVDEDGNRHNMSCDENSDCINRLTLIECINELCESSCGENCQNQRFQKKQYADISVFQTEMKGYGVRCNTDLEANEFIYEYIGEVIDEESFRDRLIKYDEMHFKHFYFMMLQNGQFIDATRKGALGRFCNHSCNPNAYVNKWVVNGKLKMGIFSKRKIQKGEEITFDYNVDRYGANAQKCYCGEPNCIGFLGGKTQTDSASLLPQSYADALGVKVSMERKWIKEKKAKGEKIVKSKEGSENINVEFVESLEDLPCETIEDVTRVMSVLLQNENTLIASKLFKRLYLISDESLYYQVIKLHGYKCFTKLLKLFADDIKIEEAIVNFLDNLPKTTKNGIVASQIDTSITMISEKYPSLKGSCSKLLEKWDAYETYTRISKREISELSSASSSTINKIMDFRRVRLPPGWEIIQENGRPMYYNAQQKRKLSEPPDNSGYRSNDFNSRMESKRNKRLRRIDEERERKKRKEYFLEEQNAIERAKKEELEQMKLKMKMETEKRNVLDQIIADANKKKDLEEEKNNDATKKNIKKEPTPKRHTHRYEHHWNKFFASFVPNLVRKYESDVHLTHDHMKECSRDIVKILTSKELKKDPKNMPPEKLNKDKHAKVKSFVKSYMDKFIAKYKQKKQEHRKSSASSSHHLNGSTASAVGQ